MVTMTTLVIFWGGFRSIDSQKEIIPKITQ